MDAPSPKRNRLTTVLVFLLLINILGDIGNIAFWFASPDSQASLRGSALAGALGGDTALIVASLFLAAVAVAFAVAALGLLRGRAWGGASGHGCRGRQPGHGAGHLPVQ